MLLPAFFSYTFDDPRKLVGRTVVFYAGLLTTLVPLGVLAVRRTAWTQIVSGVVTAAIGVLLLVTDGFAGLTSVDSQSALEQRAAGLAAQVPDTALIGVALLLVVAALAALRLRRSKVSE